MYTLWYSRTHCFNNSSLKKDLLLASSLSFQLCSHYPSFGSRLFSLFLPSQALLQTCSFCLESHPPVFSWQFSLQFHIFRLAFVSHSPHFNLLLISVSCFYSFSSVYHSVKLYEVKDYFLFLFTKLQDP